MLIALGGLPCARMLTLAPLLAPQIVAVRLRINAIEQAMCIVGSTEWGPERYPTVRYLVPDNLRSGPTVIVAGFGGRDRL